jgi:hypothetical protein
MPDILDRNKADNFTALALGVPLRLYDCLSYAYLICW